MAIDCPFRDFGRSSKSRVIVVRSGVLEAANMWTTDFRPFLLAEEENTRSLVSDAAMTSCAQKVLRDFLDPPAGLIRDSKL